MKSYKVYRYTLMGDIVEYGTYEQFHHGLYDAIRSALRDSEYINRDGIYDTARRWMLGVVTECTMGKPLSPLTCFGRVVVEDEKGNDGP